MKSEKFNNPLVASQFALFIFRTTEVGLVVQYLNCGLHILQMQGLLKRMFTICVFR